MSNSLRPHGLQHTRLLYAPLSYGVSSNSCPLSWWCFLTISSSASPFSFCLQSLPASGSFPMSWLIEAETLVHVTKVLEFQLQHQSFQWIFRVDFLQDWLVWSPCRPRDSQESSPAPQFKGTNFSALSLLYGLALRSIHDYWKNHGFDCMDFCQQNDVSAF